MLLLLDIIVTYIKENIITKLQKLYSPPRKFLHRRFITRVQNIYWKAWRSLLRAPPLLILFYVLIVLLKYCHKIKNMCVQLFTCLNIIAWWNKKKHKRFGRFYVTYSQTQVNHTNFFIAKLGIYYTYFNYTYK